MKEVKPEKVGLRLEWVEAGTLREHPLNWRKHPEGQAKAMKAALGEVGWVKPLIFNERTGRLLDGHLRKEISGAKDVVPVLIGDWSEEDERLILLTHDPIAMMAEASAKELQDVMAAADLGEGFEEMVAGLDDQLAAALESFGEVLDDGEERGEMDGDGEGLGVAKPQAAVKKGTVFEVVIECGDELAQKRAFELIDGMGVECKVTTMY